MNNVNARDELKLVFPTEEYKEQIEEYLKNILKQENMNQQEMEDQIE